jgi:LytS/YehU family sensor histidine kinase
VALARRFAPGRTRWGVLLAAHAVGAAAATMLHLGGAVLLIRILARAPHLLPPLETQLRGGLAVTWPTRAATYFLIVGAAWAVDAWRAFQERELAAARLERDVAQARLEAVKLRLRPRFVFSALEAIRPLVYRDPRAAARSVVDLGDLLRLSLQSDAGRLVPLSDELSSLRLYLRLEAGRLAPDRASIDCSPGAESGVVPVLLLQPVVELALARAGMPCSRLRLEARAEPPGLRIDIEARGAGGAADAEEDATILRTGERLRHIYGPDAELIFEPASGGARVTFALPERPAGAAEGAA